MMNKLTVIASAIALVSSGAALAHQHKAGTSHKAGASETQKCEMMKDGKKMPGMMQIAKWITAKWVKRWIIAKWAMVRPKQNRPSRNS